MKQNISSHHPDLKRHYIALFFDKFLIKDGEIKTTTPNKEIKPLLKNGQISVRVRTNWLATWVDFRTIYES